MLSVICPVYNEEKYIVSCIESILQQDYPRNEMEVLFVDGMSTDRTRKLLKLTCGSILFCECLIILKK